MQRAPDVAVRGLVACVLSECIGAVAPALERPRRRGGLRPPDRLAFLPRAPPPAPRKATLPQVSFDPWGFLVQGGANGADCGQALSGQRNAAEARRGDRMGERDQGED